MRAVPCSDRTLHSLARTGADTLDNSQPADGQLQGMMWLRESEQDTTLKPVKPGSIRGLSHGSALSSL